MVDPGTTQRWLYHTLFAGLAMMILILQLVPFGGGSVAVPGPDVLTCLVLVWIQRRPDFLPLLLLASVLLLADFLLLRPPGLWAALTLMGAEFLRRVTAGSREITFAAEWGFAAGVILAMTVAHWALNALVSAPAIPLGLSIVQAITTIIAYPFVLWLSQSAFNIRKPAFDGQNQRGI